MGMSFVVADSDHIEIPSGSWLHGESAWTIEILFRSTVGGYMYGESDGSTGNPFIFVRMISGDVAGKFRGSSAVNSIETAVGTYGDGNWYHLVYVKRAIDDFELYVNGVSVGTDTNTGDTGTATNGYISRLSQGSSFYYTGDIGFVRTYKSALGIDEITMLSKTWGCRPWSPINAEWMLDDFPAGTTATTAVDTGPNGYHGTPANTPVSVETPISAPQRGAS